jgi:poly-gamma-glutamate synthesis protein (capsule biosynthesis protein)
MWRVLGLAVVLTVSACAGAAPAVPDRPSAGPNHPPAPVSSAGPTGSSAGSSGGSSGGPSTGSSTAPVDQPVGALPPSPAPGTITLAFGGDVNFDGPLADLVQRPDGLADLRPVLAGADLAMVNLETAITQRGSPEAKIYHFRTTPRALVTLQQAGVDAVSMADNHAVDHGPDGLTDSLAAKAASPIPVISIGRTASEAFAPALFTVRGVRVAVLASTQVNDLTVNKYPATDTRPGIAGNLDDTRLLSAVRAAAASTDVVVVFLHWGTDYTSWPDSTQTSTAAALEKAGADVIVGAHAHRVQGSGWLGRAYVAYGLGDFVWHNTRGELDARSGVLTVAVDVARVQARKAAGAPARSTAPSLVTATTWTPLVIRDDGVPRTPAPEVARSVHEAWEQARTCARLAASPAR